MTLKSTLKLRQGLASVSLAPKDTISTRSPGSLIDDSRSNFLYQKLYWICKRKKKNDLEKKKGEGQTDKTQRQTASEAGRKRKRERGKQVFPHQN